MKLKYLFFYSLLLVLCFPKYVAAAGLSLGIYPPIIEVQTTPPSSPETPISIQNFDGFPVELSIQPRPIRQNRLNNGTIEFIKYSDQDSLSKFVQNRIQILDEGKKINTITLNPYETKNLVLNVNTLKADPPGDFYYSIVFLSKGTEIDQSSASQLPGGISANLLISIGPKDATKGEIEEFTTKPFLEAGPVPFTVLLKNQSKHLVIPVGNIIIKNALGKEVGKVDVLPQYVLADSKRYLIDKSQVGTDGLNEINYTNSENPQAIWKEKFLLGFYKATLNLKLDDGAQNLTKTVVFFAFPTYLYFIIIIAIFVSLSIYLKVKKKI